MPFKRDPNRSVDSSALDEPYFQQKRDYSGYHDCPCRDCFEVAIGGEVVKGRENRYKPALCHECETAGCEPCDCLDPDRGCPHGECCAPSRDEDFDFGEE